MNTPRGDSRSPGAPKELNAGLSLRDGEHTRRMVWRSGSNLEKRPSRASFLQSYACLHDVFEITDHRTASVVHGMEGPVMTKFKDIHEYSFGWSAQDHETRLLLPEVTATIRALATKDTATRGGSKCKACAGRISSGMQRCIFQWLRNGWGWSAPSFVHARPEDCANVEVCDARQQASYKHEEFLANQ